MWQTHFLAILHIPPQSSLQLRDQEAPNALGGTWAMGYLTGGNKDELSGEGPACRVRTWVQLPACPIALDLIPSSTSCRSSF